MVECAGAGGEFHDGSACTPGLCTVATGACCASDDTCSGGVTETECTSSGGSYRGDSSSCLPDPCVPGLCDVALIGPISNLKLVKSCDASDIIMTWAAELDANGYNVWFVDRKTDLPAADGSPPSLPVAGCLATAATTCTHAGAVSGPGSDANFYNVIGLCDGVQAPM